jgi:hypothetical protein
MGEPMTESIRTVCHGCRQVTQYRDDAGTIRPMVLPGNGTVWADRAPGGMVEEPCPMCGESDDPGWLPGFLPPV